MKVRITSLNEVFGLFKKKQQPSQQTPREKYADAPYIKENTRFFINPQSPFVLMQLVTEREARTTGYKQNETNVPGAREVGLPYEMVVDKETLSALGFNIQELKNKTRDLFAQVSAQDSVDGSFKDWQGVRFFVWKQNIKDSQYNKQLAAYRSANMQKESKKVKKKIVNEKEFSKERREKDASKGFALPDGSYPIETVADLKRAIQAFGRAKDQSKAAAHIAKRAKALGREDLIPDTENFSKKKTKMSENKSSLFENFKSFEEEYPGGILLAGTDERQIEADFDNVLRDDDGDVITYTELDNYRNVREYDANDIYEDAEEYYYTKGLLGPEVDSEEQIPAVPKQMYIKYITDNFYKVDGQNVYVRKNDDEVRNMMYRHAIKPDSIEARGRFWRP